MKVLVLLTKILVFDHEFANRGLLGEIKLVDSRVEKIIVYVVQADDYLGADRFDSWFFINLWLIQSLSDVAEALHIEVWLVAKNDRELLEQHVHYIVVTHKNFFLLSLFSKCILRRHGSRWLGYKSPVRSLNVLEDFFGYDVRADIRVLCEEDDDFIAGDSNSHICTAGVRHSKRDELAHHQVQVQGRHVCSERSHNEFEQIKSLEVHIGILIFKELAKQDLHGLNLVSGCCRGYDCHLLLNDLLDLNNSL